MERHVDGPGRRPTARSEPADVLIADDDGDFRAALADYFEQIGLITVEAVEGREALAFVGSVAPSLVIAEVVLPGISGYELCAQVKRRFAGSVPVVLISELRPLPCDRVAGLLIGADDYLVKPIAFDELANRVRRLLERQRSDQPGGQGALTPREREVLTLLALGLEQREIAESLSITDRTVGTHIERILNKLGVRSRAQAVGVAYREGLVDPAAVVDLRDERVVKARTTRTTSSRAAS